VSHMLVKSALVVEEHGPSLEQRTSAGKARRGIAQPLARDAVVMVAMRADDLNHAFEHLASGSGLPPRWACGAFTASAEIIAGVRCGLDERQFEDGAARPDPPVTTGGGWRFDTVVHEHWPLRDQESASPPPFSQTLSEDVARLIQRIGSIFDVTAEHHCLVPLVRWQNIGPERIRD